MRLTEFQTNISNKPCISEILSLAETQYCRIYLIVQWSGIDTKINSTSFTSIANGNYFNCGGSHSLKYCCKPHNGERIKANKKLFYKKKKKVKANLNAKKGSDC